MWAAYSTLVSRIAEAGYETLTATKRIFAWGLLFMAPALPFAGTFPAEALGNPLVVPNLLFLGLLASAACFATWNFAVKHLGAVVTSTYIYLVPALTAPPQPSWLGEPMTPPSSAASPHHRRPHAFEPQRLSPRATPRPRLALLFVDVVQWPERQGIAARTSSMALTHHHRHVEERNPRGRYSRSRPNRLRDGGGPAHLVAADHPGRAARSGGPDDLRGGADEPLEAIDASGLIIADENFSELQAAHARFANCFLSCCDFSGSLFTDTVFEGCDFANSYFDSAGFTRCTFKNCKLTGASFMEANLEHVALEDCTLDFGAFNRCRFWAVSATRCDFSGADMAEMELHYVTLDDDRFIGTSFFRHAPARARFLHLSAGGRGALRHHGRNLRHEDERLSGRSLSPPPRRHRGGVA